MSWQNRLRLIFFIFLIQADCTPFAIRPSEEVTFHGDYLLYRGKRFTGTLVEKFAHVGTTRYGHYQSGLQSGIEEEFFWNGQIASRRSYSQGKKEGIHEGWFSNGNRRFHHEFQNNHPTGEAWEWYSSGTLALFARFEAGRLVGKKMWRETGQIYMNYVFPQNRAVGVPGSKLCYQIRG